MLPRLGEEVVEDLERKESREHFDFLAEDDDDFFGGDLEDLVGVFAMANDCTHCTFGREDSLLVWLVVSIDVSAWLNCF